MRVILISLSLFALWVEAIFWVFLSPVPVRVMFGLVGLAMGAGVGAGIGVNSALTGIPCLLAMFLIAPTAAFAKLKVRRVNWWREIICTFPEFGRRFGNLILDAPGPFLFR